MCISTIVHAAWDTKRSIRKTKWRGGQSGGEERGHALLVVMCEHGKGHGCEPIRREQVRSKRAGVTLNAGFNMNARDEMRVVKTEVPLPLPLPSPPPRPPAISPWGCDGSWRASRVVDHLQLDGGGHYLFELTLPHLPQRKEKECPPPERQSFPGSLHVLATLRHIPCVLRLRHGLHSTAMSPFVIRLHARNAGLWWCDNRLSSRVSVRGLGGVVRPRYRSWTPFHRHYPSGIVRDLSVYGTT